MSVQDPEKIEALLSELVDQIPDPRIANRRSVGVSLGTTVLLAGIWYGTVDPRHDPWTGADAERVHSAFEHRLSKQEAELHQLREDMGTAEKDLWALEIRLKSWVDRSAIVHESVRVHHEKSERYINDIERNTVIILDNQRKAHTHK